MRYWFISIGPLTLLLSGGAANAQVPGPANPGRLDQRFQLPSVPQSTPSVTIPPPTAVVPSEQAEQTRFVLTGVSVEGDTVFTPTDFVPLYSALLGKRVSLADIYRLRDAITAKYRRAGYILSQAIVPPQAIAGGIVRITAVEGYIDTVTIEGAADPRGLIAAIADKLTKSRPLRAGDLERATLLINDLPGVTARTVLKPSAIHPGASELIVTVERKKVGGSLGVNDLGSRAIGPVQFFAGADFNSLLGLDEQTSMQLATTAQTKELRYISARHVETLNADGLQLTLSGSYSKSQPGGVIEALDARGSGTILSIGLSQPVVRSRAKTLRLGLGFTVMNTKTDLLAAPFASDRVRYISANLSYDYSDEMFGAGAPASSLLRVELDQGLKILNASQNGSPLASRAYGQSDFTLINGDLTRVQSLGSGVSLAIVAAGQYAFVPLLSSQQFGLGGRQFGRGYEPSELTGDNGAAVSIEPRVDVSRIAPALQPQLYAFWEAGTVWQKRPLSGQPKHDSLSSAGGGVRFQIMPYIHADIGAAKPLTRDIASRGNRRVRFLFDLTASF